MIISDKYKFCFIHIPKCAGTSVRNKLQIFDDNHGQFTARIDNHPELGPLDYVHIPLETLKRYFPDEYEKIKQYYTVALVRDPYARFSSSLTEHLKISSNKITKSISEKDFLREAERCIQVLIENNNRSVLMPSYIHFQRQCSYIFNDGECLVDKLYTINQIDVLIEDISRRIGGGTIIEKNGTPVFANKSFVYRSSSIGFFYKILYPFFKEPLSWVLPNNLKEKIRGVVYISRDRRLKNFSESKKIRDFIAEYYVDDIQMFQEVCSSSQS